jgi:hypothetical protein
VNRDFFIGLPSSTKSCQKSPVHAVYQLGKLTGDAPDEKALQWFKDFALAQKRLLLYRQDEDWFAFGPPAFQVEMHERMARDDKLW